MRSIKTPLILATILLLTTSSLALSHPTPRTNPQPLAVTLTIIDDGCPPNDLIVPIPAYHPGTGQTPFYTVLFRIDGTGGGTQTYYGDDPWEDWHNITLTGGVLYPLDATRISHISNGTWSAQVTPTDPFTLTINWPGNGTSSATIYTENSLAIAPLVPTNFTYQVPKTITLALADPDGDPIKIANLYAYRALDHVEIYATHGDNTQGNGANGVYTFLLNATDQGITPQDVIIAANYSIFNSYIRFYPGLPESTLMIIWGRVDVNAFNDTAKILTCVRAHAIFLDPFTMDRYSSGEAFIATKTIWAHDSGPYIFGIYQAYPKY